MGAIAPAPGRLFVGRERELEELSSGLADARDGHGRLFLLVGEPGIGKTRLADELSQQALAGGARVLWGRCWESGGAPAYWPWTQLLRAYLREIPLDVAVAQMGAGVRDIAQLSPWLREHLDAATSEGPEAARFGLFDSLSSFLQAAAAAQPLVLILDDLHAADEASLRLLLFLARELRGAALLIVGTYRDSDLRRTPSLLPIVADLAREGHRLALRGLGPAEVERFIAGASVPRRDELVASIHKATGGNPFFVTEVVRLGLDDSAEQRHGESAMFQVPDEVREAIRRRLAPLSPAAAKVLSIAAVLGREFDAGLVEPVADLGEACGDALAEAEASGLIQDLARDNRYAFAHELVRQTLYSDLRPSRRVMMHRAVAEALEAQGGDPEPRLADLAHHYYHAAAAGVADQAVRYTTRAAEQAMRQRAYEEAASQYERALHALSLAPEPPADTGRAAVARATLLLALGDAQCATGTQARWRPTFLRAATVARSALGSAQVREATRLLAHAALGLGRSSETGTVDEELVALLRESLESLDAVADGDKVVRARLLARSSMALYFSPDSGRGERLSREALRLARRTGDDATVVRCLVALHFALWRPDHLEERRRVAAETIERAERAHEPEMVLEGRLWLLVDELERGDGEAAACQMDAVAKAASALRHPLYRWHAELHRAMRALVDGRVDEADRISGAALEFGERAGLPNSRQAFGVQAFWIRREQGRLAELEEHLRVVAERFRIPIWRCGLALLHAETGRAAEARRALASLVDDDFASLPIDGNWPSGMAILALVCAEVGDRAPARRIYDRLLPYAGRMVVIAQAHVCLGPVAYFLGRLAALDERWDIAAAHFEDAVRVGESFGAALLVANARYELAAALRVLAPDDARTAATIAAVRAAARLLDLPRLSARVETLPWSESMHVEALPPPSESVSPPPEARPRAAPIAVFRKEGDYWTVSFDGTESRLKHTRGLSYLAEMLRHPDRELHTLDLAVRFRGEAGDGPEPGHDDAGPRLDATAKAAYRERVEQVRAEIEEATALNDLGRAERARAELDVLTHELAAAVGLGRRDRKSHSNAERSRVAVTKAVGGALKAIAETNPTLRRYLGGTIKTGQFCSYTPDPRFPVTWTLA